MGYLKRRILVYIEHVQFPIVTVALLYYLGSKTIPYSHFLYGIYIALDIISQSTQEDNKLYANTTPFFMKYGSPQILLSVEHPEFFFS